WLVVRVTLQTSLSELEYKNFMLYFMVFILNRATTLGVKSDILSIMSKKISRRAAKIGSNHIPSGLMQVIGEAIERTTSTLRERWRKVITKSEGSIYSSSKKLSPTADTALTLTNSKSWIEERLRVFRAPQHRRNNVEDPKEFSRNKTSYFDLPCIHAGLS